MRTDFLALRAFAVFADLAVWPDGGLILLPIGVDRPVVVDRGLGVGHADDVVANRPGVGGDPLGHSVLAKVDVGVGSNWDQAH